MVKSNELKALRPSQRMRVAYLLTLVGGMLDAYTYVLRGGVFANAQTGNIVKLGIALANGARDRYLFYLLPIASFALGILVALLMEYLLERRGLRLVRRSILSVELAGLALVWLLPLGEAWDWPANCIVSFVAALQFETFKTFHGEAITTTMSTGNLRKFVESLFQGIVHHDRERLRSAAQFLSIILTFCFGAYVGTVSCDRMGRHALTPSILCLIAAIVVITLLRRRNGNEAGE